MIKTYEYLRDDGAKLVRRVSNSGFKIIQNETGAIYDEAIDLPDSTYTYSETNIKAEISYEE